MAIAIAIDIDIDIVNHNDMRAWKESGKVRNMEGRD